MNMYPKDFKIGLESFCEDISDEMERIQDGGGSHIVVFRGMDKGGCAKIVANRLLPFIEGQLSAD